MTFHLGDVVADRCDHCGRVIATDTHDGIALVQFLDYTSWRVMDGLEPVEVAA